MSSSFDIFGALAAANSLYDISHKDSFAIVAVIALLICSYNIIISFVQNRKAPSCCDLLYCIIVTILGISIIVSMHESGPICILIIILMLMISFTVLSLCMQEKRDEQTAKTDTNSKSHCQTKRKITRIVKVFVCFSWIVGLICVVFTPKGGNPIISETRPVLTGIEGISCVRKTNTSTGPSSEYIRLGTTYIDQRDMDVSVYATENNYAFIRYRKTTNGLPDGYRFGWVDASAFSPESIALIATSKLTPFSDVRAQVSNSTIITDDPLETKRVNMSLSTGTGVTVLAYLDESYEWAYCEVENVGTDGAQRIRGFILATDLEIIQQSIDE